MSWLKVWVGFRSRFKNGKFGSAAKFKGNVDPRFYSRFADILISYPGIVPGYSMIQPYDVTYLAGHAVFVCRLST